MPDQWQEFISQARQHQPQIVGGKSMTGQAIRKTHVFDLFDPVFGGFSPLHIKVRINFLGILSGKVSSKPACPRGVAEQAGKRRFMPLPVDSILA